MKPEGTNDSLSRPLLVVLVLGIGLFASHRASAGGHAGDVCTHNSDCTAGGVACDKNKTPNVCCVPSQWSSCTVDSQCCADTTDCCTNVPNGGKTCCARLLSDGGGNRCVSDEDCCGAYNGGWFGYYSWKTTGFNNGGGGSFYDCNSRTNQCEACYPDGHKTTTPGPDDGGLTLFPPDGGIITPVCCSGAANEWPPNTAVTCCHPVGSACYEGAAGQVNEPYCCNSERDAQFVAANPGVNPQVTCGSGLCCITTNNSCANDNQCCSGKCDSHLKTCKACYQ